MIVLHKTRFLFVFSSLSRRLGVLVIVVALVHCSCRRFGAAGGYVVSVQQFDFRCRGATFICVLVIQTNKLNIYD